MSVTLPALPYADDALAPHISANTMSFHYGKHHQFVRGNEVERESATHEHAGKRYGEESIGFRDEIRLFTGTEC